MIMWNNTTLNPHCAPTDARPPNFLDTLKLLFQRLYDDKVNWKPMPQASLTIDITPYNTLDKPLFFPDNINKSFILKIILKDKFF